MEALGKALVFTPRQIVILKSIHALLGTSQSHSFFILTAAVVILQLFIKNLLQFLDLSLLNILVDL